MSNDDAAMLTVTLQQRGDERSGVRNLLTGTNKGSCWSDRACRHLAGPSGQHCRTKRLRPLGGALTGSRGQLSGERLTKAARQVVRHGYATPEYKQRIPKHLKRSTTRRAVSTSDAYRSAREARLLMRAAPVGLQSSLTEGSHLGCGELYGTGGDVRLEVRNRRGARNR
jgi:hypothetical protein